MHGSLADPEIGMSGYNPVFDGLFVVTTL